MAFPLSKKRRRQIAFVIGASTLTILFLISGLFQWSPLNCWHQDVDINSGRIRHTRFLLYVQIGERIKDTGLSRDTDSERVSPDWHHVNTFSPGVPYSPNYRFHGAINQIKTLELASQILPFTLAARRKVGDRVLALWQKNRSHYAADRYIDLIYETAVANEGREATVITVTDIPEQ